MQLQVHTIIGVLSGISSFGCCLLLHHREGREGQQGRNSEFRIPVPTLPLSGAYLAFYSRLSHILLGKC